MSHMLFLLLLASTLPCGFGKGGGGAGGGRGSRSSKQDLIRRTNTSATEEFTFWAWYEDAQEKTKPPIQSGHSELFKRFINTFGTHPLRLDQIVYFYSTNPEFTKEWWANKSQVENVNICTYTLEDLDVEDQPSLVGKHIVFECESKADNSTLVECRTRWCHVTRYQYYRILGKGAFTLIIFSLIAFIFALMTAWVYYSKTKELQMREQHQREFEAKKIKPPTDEVQEQTKDCVETKVNPLASSPLITITEHTSNC